MRPLYLFVFLYVGLFLSACSTNQSTPSTTTQAVAKIKNPLTVTVYTKKQLITIPYTVLGKATISEYNLGGIKRQTAYIHDAMRNLAARMGGDAVIDLDKKNKMVIGTVIAYQTKETTRIS